MKNALVLAVVLFLCRASRADEGDVYVDLAVVPEASWLSHPIAGVTAFELPLASTSTLVLTPRAALVGRYGLTNNLHVGVGVEAAPATGIVSHGLKVENTTGDLFTGFYGEFGLPLSAGWRFLSGENLTAVVELQAAPIVSVWSGSALADPNLPDAQGLPSKLPVDIEDQWLVGGAVRAQALFEARVWDWFVIAVGPEVGVSWAGTLGLQAGVVIRPSFVTGAPL